MVVSMDTPATENRGEQKEKADLKGLYDLAIPLGMPVSVIRELVDKFELDAVRRKARMDMTGEVMEREILVLRGDLETVKAAEKYMFEALDRKTAEWQSDERKNKYKKYYEEKVAERVKELKENPEAAKNWDPTST
jgi:hypothetical protein